MNTIAADPAGAANPLSAQSVVSTPGPTRTSGIEVTKSASPPSFTGPNQTINYTVAVRNTGNVRLSGIVVTDTLLAGFPCNITSIEPGDTDTTCTGSYLTDQNDVNLGSRTNTATAIGNDPMGGTPTDDDTLVVPGPTANPGISISKTSTPSPFALNDTITYQISVQNTGNVTLSGVEVSDPLIFWHTLPDCCNFNRALLTRAVAVHMWRNSQTLIQVSITNNADVTANPPTGPPVAASTTLVYRRPDADPVHFSRQIPIPYQPQPMTPLATL